MGGNNRIHDRAILDSLEVFTPESFHGEVWRVTRQGRGATKGSVANGRWSPNGEFDVLYTSLVREGALAEVKYRLSLEPVWPSKVQHELHRISIHTARTLRFPNLEGLSSLGVDVLRYESFDYATTQSVAAAAYFLDFDGLIVPSARYNCHNLVVFLDRLAPDAHFEIITTEVVNWNK